MKKTKRVVNKQHDLCDYGKMDFNPFVLSAETISHLRNAEYDPAHAQHRARMDKWKQRESDRAALAAKLGVTYKPVLTPASEVLAKSNNADILDV